MSVIYKISCKDKTITDSYIGSTIDFYRRKQQHINNCNNKNDKHNNLKLYKFIRDNGGFDNWKFDILEELETTDKFEMRDIERKYIEDKDNNSTLNSSIPNRKQNEYLKDYYNDNKEKIKERTKQYRKQNKEKISIMKKEYYNQNKEKFNEKSKQYYDENKEKITQYKIKKINCNICSSIIIRTSIYRHQKSKKCNNIRLELLKTYFNIWKK